MDRINGQNWFDIGGGRRGFRGQNSNLGVAGTEVTEDFLNIVQEELMALAELNGIATGPGFDRKDIAKAERSRRLNYLVAAGSANDLIITLNPGITSWDEILNVPLDVKILLPNTAEAPVLRPNGLPPMPMIRRFGDPVRPYDLRPPAVMTMRWDGAHVRLDSIADNEYARVVTENPIVWVRLDGHDSHDGSDNTPEKAMATIYGAIRYGLSRYYLTAGQALQIQLGLPGNYDAPPPIANAGVINIAGGGAATYLVSGPGVAGSGVLAVGRSTQVTGSGITWVNTSNIANTIAAYSGGVVDVGSCRFGQTIATGMAVIHANGGIVNVGNNRMMGGSYGSMLNSSFGSINVSGNIALDSAMAFSTATLFATACGGVGFQTSASFTGAGATGRRWMATANGIISNNGAAETYIPGSLAGVGLSGGIYI